MCRSLMWQTVEVFVFVWVRFVSLLAALAGPAPAFSSAESGDLQCSVESQKYGLKIASPS